MMLQFSPPSTGFTAVITICPFGAEGKTFDGLEVPDALARLEAEGADVVGLNCGRGPKTMMPMIKKCKEKVKVCGLISNNLGNTGLVYQAITITISYIIIVSERLERKLS